MSVNADQFAKLGMISADPGRARVLLDVDAERDRQDAKWGDQSFRTDGTSRVFESARDRARMECDQAEQQKATTGGATWRHILREETLEAFAEIDTAKLRTELVQSAAVIVAWIENIDKRERK